MNFLKRDSKFSYKTDQSRSNRGSLKSSFYFNILYWLFELKCLAMIFLPRFARIHNSDSVLKLYHFILCAAIFGGNVDWDSCSRALRRTWLQTSLYLIDTVFRFPNLDHFTLQCYVFRNRSCSGIHFMRNVFWFCV
jgi:hypothetical protein